MQIHWLDGIVIILGNDWFGDVRVACNWLCDDSLLVLGCVVSTGGNDHISSVVSAISMYSWISLVTVAIWSFGTLPLFSSHSVVVVIFGRHVRVFSISFERHPHFCHEHWYTVKG